MKRFSLLRKYLLHLVFLLLLTLGVLYMKSSSIEFMFREFFGQSRITAILQQLKSDNLDTRVAALEELKKIAKKGLTKKEGTEALQAADSVFPPLKYDFQDTSSELVTVTSSNPQEAYIPIIRDHYGSYSVQAKQAALSLLTFINSTDATKEFVRLVDESKNNRDIHLLTTGYEKNPRHAGILFPKLLEIAEESENLQWAVYTLCLKYFQEKTLVSGSLNASSPYVLNPYRLYKKKILSLQQPKGYAWLWNDDYLRYRETAAVLLDLLGYFPDQSIIAELQLVKEIRDPELKLFASTSLLRLGQSVDPNMLLAVAEQPETRNRFYDLLKKLGKDDLYPKTYYTQEAFAESDMVHWLTYPTELGRAPDEIELMKTFTTKQGNEDVTYYLFRFRTLEPHWAAKKGWTAGVSGPFPNQNVPTTNALGGTFSALDSWDSKTPEEHFASITGTISDWWKKRAQEVNKK